MRPARLVTRRRLVPLVLADAALITAAFVAASYVTLLLDPYLYFFEEGGSVRLAPLVVVMLLAMYFADFYGGQPETSRTHRAQQLSLVAGVALLFEAFLAWIDPGAILPRSLMTFGLVLGVATLFAWRTVLQTAIQRFSAVRAVLLLGAGETLRDLAKYIAEHPGLGLAVVGSLANEDARAVSPVLGGTADLMRVVRKLRPDLIIAATSENRDEVPIADLLELRFSGVTIEDAGSACEKLCRRVCARDLRPSRMLFTHDFEPKTGQLLIPAADKLIAVCWLIPGAPIALLWAGLLALKGKPVIMRCECAGFQGATLLSRRFLIPDWGAISRYAQAIRLDRYPDLWNVLMGRMSMVGPRPEEISFDAELCRLVPIYEYRRNAKPGITGWAQLNREGTSNVPDGIRSVEYDLYYVRHQSASLYASILLHGIRQRFG
jgi:hypothetical protein